MNDFHYTPTRLTIGITLVGVLAIAFALIDRDWLEATLIAALVLSEIGWSSSDAEADHWRDRARTAERDLARANGNRP